LSVLLSFGSRRANYASRCQTNGAASVPTPHARPSNPRRRACYAAGRSDQGLRVDERSDDDNNASWRTESRFHFSSRPTDEGAFVSAQLSDFARSLTVETAFTVLGLAKALKAAGKDVVELEIGDSPFDSTAAARAGGMDAIKNNESHYCPSPGI